MTKTEFIKKLAEDQGMNPKEMLAIFDGTMAAMREAIIQGETVSLPGICTLSSKVAPERMGRNPSTGAELHIPSRWVPAIKPSQGLKVDLAARKLPKPAKKGKK